MFNKINSLIWEAIFKYRDQCAILWNDQEFTFHWLGERIKYFIQKISEYPNARRIAIHTKRNPDLIASIAAVICLGKTYVPIDTNLPTARIDFMIDDCNITLKIHTDGDSTVISPVNYSIKEENDYSDNLAYIIYTSGSTGEPKGIMVTYDSLDCFIQDFLEKIEGFNINSRILALASISFDIFFIESIYSIIRGMCIILVQEFERRNPRLLSLLMQKYRIDVLQITPSHVQMLCEENPNLPWIHSGLTILLGGERISDKLLSRIQCNCPNRIYNLYGPTEGTIWCTYSDITNSQNVNIGKPFPHTNVQIIDEYGEEVIKGNVGELYISGDAISQGYINNHELTYLHFYIGKDGKRSYKTGDLCRWNDSGNLEFKSRSDFQIKFNGYRIEPGEIETVVKEFPGVSQAIMLHWNSKLYLLYQRETSINFTKRDIYDFLKMRIPEYMLPQIYKEIDVWPLLVNGKLDRNSIIKKLERSIDYDNSRI